MYVYLFSRDTYVYYSTKSARLALRHVVACVLSVRYEGGPTGVAGGKARLFPIGCLWIVSGAYGGSRSRAWSG